MRQHLPPDEPLDAPLLQKRYLLGVPQIGVRLALHHSPPAADLRLEQPAQRVRLNRAGTGRHQPESLDS